MMATKEAATRVFLDLTTCPVPDGYDASRVGPCIKRALKKLGYSGPVSITGLGILRDVSTDILQALYSSGVSLCNIRTPCFGLELKITCSIVNRPPRDNIMLISGEKSFVGYVDMLESKKVHIIRELPLNHLRTASIPIERPDWERFLLADEIDSEDVEEDPVWSCEVCFSTGQGFESFSMHLNHKLENQASRKQPEEEEDEEEEEEEEEEEY